jgi:hypothetical protein
MSESPTSESPQQTSTTSPPDRSRRSVLKLLGVAGSATVFGRALSAVAGEEGKITGEAIERAEWIAGIRLSDEERQLMLEGVDALLESFDRIRSSRRMSSPPRTSGDPARRFASPRPRPRSGRRTTTLLPSCPSASCPR